MFDKAVQFYDLLLDLGIDLLNDRSRRLRNKEALNEVNSELEDDLVFFYGLNALSKRQDTVLV